MSIEKDYFYRYISLGAANFGRYELNDDDPEYDYDFRYLCEVDVYDGLHDYNRMDQRYWDEYTEFTSKYREFYRTISKVNLYICEWLSRERRSYAEQCRMMLWLYCEWIERQEKFVQQLYEDPMHILLSYYYYIY